MRYLVTTTVRHLIASGQYIAISIPKFVIDSNIIRIADSYDAQIVAKIIIDPFNIFKDVDIVVQPIKEPVKESITNKQDIMREKEIELLEMDKSP